MEKGAIYQIETMGLVDGPGIRTVFFLQGCPLKCRYCHNPESQDLFKKTAMYSVSDLLSKVERYQGYYKRTGGGVTFSGGEPLMQAPFLIEALDALKENGVHTVLDTSGYGQNALQEEVLKRVDMVILDIKHIHEKEHNQLTGVSLAGVQSFIHKLKRFKGKIWIRHVMVPNLTDDESTMRILVDLLNPIIKQVEKIEILPYHKYGSEKYSQLNIEDPFKDVPEMNKEKAKSLEIYANCMLLNARKQCAIEAVV
jgi:pyruvate formate lyase activating enzyme